MKENQTESLPLFRTPVEVERCMALGDEGQGFAFLGSCFSEHMGRHFLDSHLKAVVNPLGVLYNPVSILSVVQHALRQEDIEPLLFEHEGMWHCWLGDSILSAPTRETCASKVKEALLTLRNALKDADTIFITLGTNRCYRHKEQDLVVSNCHRVPQAQFCEESLSLEDTVKCLDELVGTITEANPKTRIVFTVSPFRYRKYGFHGSQLGKSILLLSVDQTIRKNPEHCFYFPAYEIVMDELRDYRFYEADMLHPSEEAVNYIWTRLCQTCMTPRMQAYIRDWEPIRKALQHRVLNTGDPANAQREARLEEQIKAFKKHYNLE